MNELFINGRPINKCTSLNLNLPEDKVALRKAEKPRSIEWTIPKEQPEYTILSAYHDWVMSICKECDKKFQEVLNKRNISIDEWKKFGKIEQFPGITYYYYKDEKIFITTQPEISEVDSDNKVTGSFYYGEP